MRRALSGRRVALGAAACAAALLAACAGGGAGGGASTGRGGEQRDRARPAEERPPGEAEILQRQRRVNALGGDYPFLWDAEVLGAVSRAGAEIARAVGAPEDQFHYYVIDKPVLNAFTSPTGDIFFFTGQLAAMRSSSELAGVLAHEIAHVRAGHYERSARHASLGTVPALAAIILSGGNPAVFAGALALLESYQLSFSREMEAEADGLSLLYLEKTSFDRRGLIGALRLIERGERLVPAGVPEGLRSHPLTTSRIAALENAIGVARGEPYRPEPDPAWDRVRAIILALDDPATALAEFGAPATPEGHDLLGVVHERRGDHAAAAAEFRLAVAAAPGEARYAIDLAGALWALGDAAGARSEAERALRLPGGAADARAHFLLAEVLRAAGAVPEAIERYRRAAQLAPQLPEAHYQLALGLSESGSLGEADFHFGRAAELVGDYVGALRSYRRARSLLGADPLWSARIEAALRHMQ